MKKLVLHFLFISCCYAVCIAQTVDIRKFTKLDVNLLQNQPKGTVVPTADGGYFMARGLKLTKYDSSNTEIWSQSLSGSSKVGYTNKITAICEDGQGGAIITGQVHGTLSSATDSLPAFFAVTGSGFYSGDAFIARINQNGKVWWNRFGEYSGNSPGTDVGIAVTVSNNKVAWIAHGTGRDLKFNNVNYPLSQYGNNIALICQFGLDGSVDWTHVTKGGGVVPVELVVSGNSVFITGFSTGSSTPIDFGNDKKINYNQASFFAVKYNNNGLAQWAVTYDDDNMLKNLYGATTDDDGNLYTCGIGSNFSTSYGIKKGQGYLIKMSGADGSLMWTRSLSKVAGATNVLHGPLLGVQFFNSKVYVCGNTNGNLYLQSEITDSVEVKLSSNLLAAEQFIAAYDKSGSLASIVKANGGSGGGTIEYLLTGGNYLIGQGTFTTNLTFGNHTMPSTGGNVGIYFIGFYTIGNSLPNALKDLAETGNIKLYPNPATTALKLNFTENVFAQSVAILNINGQKIKETTETSSIDISELSPGLYFVQVTTDKGISTQKFIKQ